MNVEQFLIEFYLFYFDFFNEQMNMGQSDKHKHTHIQIKNNTFFQLQFRNIILHIDIHVVRTEYI